MAETELQRLLDTVDRFRGETGCAWYESQTHRSLVRYLVEETAELVDAIESDNDDELREELGDVLFQVLFHASIAQVRGAFTLEDVARDQREKLVRRNPHVFGPTPTRDIDEIIRMWEAAKRVEKQHRTSVLDGIARAMPTLAHADTVLRRGAKQDADLLPSVAGTVGGSGSGASVVPQHGPAEEAVAQDAVAQDGVAQDAVTRGAAVAQGAVVQDGVAQDAVARGAAVAHGVDVLPSPTDASQPPADEAELGDRILTLVAQARVAGFDPERALRDAVRRLESRIRDFEAAHREQAP